MFFVRNPPSPYVLKSQSDAFSAQVRSMKAMRDFPHMTENDFNNLVIRSNDVDRAKVALARRYAFDPDDFFRRIEPSTLLESPLGPQKECLSIEQIAHIEQVIRIGGLLNSKDPNDRKSIQHIAECIYCRDNLDIYESIKSDPESTAVRINVSCEHVIKWKQSNKVLLKLTANEHCFQHSVTIDPASIIIDGIITARGCDLLKKSTHTDTPYRSLWKATLRPEWRNDLTLMKGHKFYDILTMSGFTYSGERFFSRVFANFQSCHE